MSAKLPFAPLTDALGQVFYEQPLRDCAEWRCWRMNQSTWKLKTGSNTGTLAELTGYNRRTLVRWRREGIPLEDADRIAVALGLHPASIWSEWWQA